MDELKIGIVAEGISDYWVIKHIVERFLKGKEVNCEVCSNQIINKIQINFLIN
jgi:hypothetical protein